MKAKNNKKSVGKFHLIERETAAKDLLEEMGLQEMAAGTNPRFLDPRFSQVMFDELYLKPLTDAGMEVEAALDLILHGMIMPN